MSNTLKSKLVVPPLGSSDWVQDQSSLIQNESSNSIRRSQRAYLLIRCAASNNYSINELAADLRNYLIDYLLN